MTYAGTVTPGALNWSVTVDGAPLAQRHDLVNHSADGFAWGYQGSGPAQLAAALLAHFYADQGYPQAEADKRALFFYLDFLHAWVGKLDKDAGWTAESGELAVVVLAMEQRTRARRA